MKTHTKKTIYLAGPLAEALRKRPDINFTRICQMALESAAGLSSAPAQPSPEMVSELERIESLARNSRLTLEKIAKLAAYQAGMVVLTEKEAETYQKILGVGIGAFIHRTKQDAVTAYKAELEKLRIAKQHARKNKADKINTPPEIAKCVDCGEPSDVQCARCGAPLCWICWTGTDLESQATELCQQCLCGESPNTIGCRESSTKSK